MSTCSTAKRRRRQAADGYRHLPPSLRPSFSRSKAAGGSATTGIKGVKVKR